jgi:acyl carrier protein
MNRDELRGFLSDRLGVDVEGLADDDPLFSSGVLDSFSMVDLILFIEKVSGRRMPAGDVRLDHLDSVDRVLAYCTAKGGQTG